MDRFPPAEDGPQYELNALARTMDDLFPDQKVEPRSFLPVIWAAVSSLVLIAFMVWLLLS